MLYLFQTLLSIGSYLILDSCILSCSSLICDFRSLFSWIGGTRKIHNVPRGSVQRWRYPVFKPIHYRKFRNLYWSPIRLSNQKSVPHRPFTWNLSHCDLSSFCSYCIFYGSEEHLVPPFCIIFWYPQATPSVALPCVSPPWWSSLWRLLILTREGSPHSELFFKFLSKWLRLFITCS